MSTKCTRYKRILYIGNLSLYISVLGIADKVGNFEVGKEFDALRINSLVPNSPFDVFPSDSFEDVVQKFFFLGELIDNE